MTQPTIPGQLIALDHRRGPNGWELCATAIGQDGQEVVGRLSINPENVGTTRVLFTPATDLGPGTTQAEMDSVLDVQHAESIAAADVSPAVAAEQAAVAGTPLPVDQVIEPVTPGERNGTITSAQPGLRGRNA